MTHLKRRVWWWVHTFPQEQSNPAGGHMQSTTICHQTFDFGSLLVASPDAVIVQIDCCCLAVASYRYSRGLDKQHHARFFKIFSRIGGLTPSVVRALHSNKRACGTQPEQSLRLGQ